MSNAAFVESRTYRSTVGLLSLYCLYRVLLFAWGLWPFLQWHFRENDLGLAEFLISYPLICITPAVILLMLVLNLYHGGKARTARLVLLGGWLLFDLRALPLLFSFQMDALNILLFLFNVLCMGLLLFVLRRDGQTPRADAPKRAE